MFVTQVLIVLAIVPFHFQVTYSSYQCVAST
jgi:hypothetical protein